MVMLFCAIVGVEGNAFSIDIDASKPVDQLKDAIQKKNEQSIKCDSRELELFLARKGNKWLNNQDVAAVVLDKHGHPVGFDHMDEMTDIVDYFGEGFARKRGEIHVLVVVPSDEKAHNRGFVGASLTWADGINPSTPHFNRDDILARMYHWITGVEGKNRLLLLNSPAASGKTSLLIMLQHKYPDLNAKYVSMQNPKSAWDILSDFGLRYPTGCDYKNVVYLLDDAQAKYSETIFWIGLIKAGTVYFGSGVRFIISATHVISTTAEPSPVQFQDLETIRRGDLLLSDDQSLQLLSAPSPLGLKTDLQQFSQLKQTIVEHCYGLIGALCKSVAFYAENVRHPTNEVECLRLFYSKGFVEQMGRCFGTIDQSQISPEMSAALLKCVVGERIDSTCHGNQSLAIVVASLAKAGILLLDADKNYGFSSLLAKRYFTNRYFPGRADHDPSSLQDLVISAIASMSATSLKLSTSSLDDFPKETTFQHLFMMGLLKNTRLNTAICSELSRSFATSSNVKGEIDFFVDGNCMWGIELVRNGAQIGEHINRFSPRGKYAGLQSKDYVIVDFRKGVANVRQNPHRVTVFFDMDLSGNTCFDHVVVKYGDEEEFNLKLQP